MMYNFLKILARLTVKVYFKHLNISGKKWTNIKGPVIYVANHPSAFMDPVVIASLLKEKMYFLAAGEYMGKGVKFKFMNRFLNMIPIYRPSTMPGETHKNEAAFQRCFEHLKGNKSILVFPEGVSVTDKKIKPIKTGVARIALGFHEQYKEDIRIIPIGLNYSSPHEFRSDLQINIGQPISIKHWLKSLTDQNFDLVKELTEEIESQMIQTVLQLEDEKAEVLVDRINALYARGLYNELGIHKGDLDQKFILNKTISNSIKTLEESYPSDFKEFNLQLFQYFESLKSEQLTDRDIQLYASGIKMYRIIYLLGLPFFLLGWIINVLPYTFVKWMVRKIDIKETFEGSIGLALGMIAFFLWFIGLTILSFLVLPFPYSLLSFTLPIIAYLAGIYALIYGQSFMYFKRRKSAFISLSANKELAENLLNERTLILEHIRNLRKKIT